jgi:hypothetical protein
VLQIVDFLLTFGVVAEQPFLFVLRTPELVLLLLVDLCLEELHFSLFLFIIDLVLKISTMLLLVDSIVLKFQFVQLSLHLDLQHFLATLKIIDEGLPLLRQLLVLGSENCLQPIRLSIEPKQCFLILADFLFLFLLKSVLLKTNLLPHFVQFIITPLLLIFQVVPEPLLLHSGLVLERLLFNLSPSDCILGNFLKIIPKFIDEEFQLFDLLLTVLSQRDLSRYKMVNEVPPIHELTFLHIDL